MYRNYWKWPKLAISNPFQYNFVSVFEIFNTDSPCGTHPHILIVISDSHQYLVVCAKIFSPQPIYATTMGNDVYLYLYLYIILVSINNNNKTN